MPLTTLVLAQPVVALQVSVVQTLPSLQLRAEPAVQVPPWQVSAPLQALPSGHAVPLSTGVLLQPNVALQASVVQTLESLQLRGVPAVQVPLWQDSAPLHTLASRHGVPFSTGVLAQPLVALQVSVVQTLESLQLRGVPAVQTPARQVSAPLHTVLSGHAVPLARFGLEHTPAVQTSLVHGLPSAQLAPVVQD